MTEPEIKQALRVHIAAKARVPPEEVPLDGNLFELGILTSMRLVSVFAFMETQLGVDSAGIESFEDLVSIDNIYRRFFT